VGARLAHCDADLVRCARRAGFQWHCAGGRFSVPADFDAFHL
jgi:hypothetical protein